MIEFSLDCVPQKGREIAASNTNVDQDLHINKQELFVSDLVKFSFDGNINKAQPGETSHSGELDAGICNECLKSKKEPKIKIATKPKQNSESNQGRFIHKGSKSYMHNLTVHPQTCERTPLKESSNDIEIEMFYLLY